MLDLTRKYNLIYNVWINLGLTINISYNMLEKSKINPSETVSHTMNNIRILQIHSYFLQVVNTYYTIKYYDAASYVNIELKHIISKNTISDLRTKMPELDSDILKQYNYYKETESDDKLANFILGALSNTILQIDKYLNKIEVNVADAIMKYIINGIINTEITLSKIDINLLKKQTLYEKDDNILSDSDADSDVEYSERESDNESEKSLDELVDGDLKDPFALNDMDIEHDADENLMANPMDF